MCGAAVPRKSRICIPCGRKRLVGAGRKQASEVASLGMRFLAFFIDGLIGSAVFAAVFYFLTKIAGIDFLAAMQMLSAADTVDTGLSDAAMRPLILVIYVTFASLFVYGFFLGLCYHFLAATLGKAMLGMQVESASTGKKTGFFIGMFRETVGKFFSQILMLGYIVAFFNDDKRALHDYMFRTIVTQR